MTNLSRLPQRSDDQNVMPTRWQRTWLRGLRGLLRDLFPESAGRPGALGEWAASNRLLAVAVQVTAVGVGAILLLGRVPGTPAWAGIYAEDLSVFLVDALRHPWSHLLMPSAGYMQLVPQTLAQFASMLPLPDVAAFLAISGALIAAGCALFVFHASAGHIHSPLLRALLGLAVLLLPVAPLEIVDSGVNTPWYLMMALFWAALWRPRSRAGMALAALLAFATVTSNALAAVFAPLLLLRVIALPRWRENAVTVGFALGCLAQVPYVLGAGSPHARVHKLARPGQAASFYGHRVVLPAFGWHLSWRLRDMMGLNTATLIVGIVLVIIFGWILLTQPRPTRLFVATALVTGFVFTMVASGVTYWVTYLPNSPTYEPGSRYTNLPILLFQAAAIVAVDVWLRGSRTRGSHARDGGAPGPGISLRSITAIGALAAVFAVGWVSDYRYVGNRAHVVVWAQASASWLRACRASPTGTIIVRTAPGNSTSIAVIPCANVHG